MMATSDVSSDQIVTSSNSVFALSGGLARQFAGQPAESRMVYGMVGASPPMRRVHDFIARVAATSTTVLIHGESGTGKELVARAIHQASRRACAPFVAVNCAAMPENLLESELFGHVRGAFTGAVADKKGKLELANGGTLLLDEVGELPLSLQAKFLRALQEREFERLGGTRPIRVDVRVIAATNADLRAATGRGAFRPDLYFRLDVVSVRLPPLRERREDIPLLAAHFSAHFSGKTSDRMGRQPAVISPDAHASLMHYDWPGNVRELQNAIERALVLGSADFIGKEDLPDAITRAGGESSPSSYRTAVQQFKQQFILGAVRSARGNVTQAAKMLDLQPNYLHRLIRNLNLKDALNEPLASAHANGHSVG